MRLKLDENLGTLGVELLRQAGHDVVTVAEQGLCSATDNALITVCLRERRCIVTLDLDSGTRSSSGPRTTPALPCYVSRPSQHNKTCLTQYGY